MLQGLNVQMNSEEEGWEREVGGTHRRERARYSELEKKANEKDEGEILAFKIQRETVSTRGFLGSIF